ncbi:Lrp/AsnC family transcriptional regulator [Peribacillus sp. NPDC006672]|uniref:Lrp/AsnC family transcriptional regulator n=1 Tax=Peribacillus sp. NPDC006672 TaxID=3390606 RepID=UPI003D037C09
MNLDYLDRQAVELLQKDSSISNAELARRLNISPPAMLNRVKRLYSEGYIERQVLIMDSSKMGFDLLSFIFLNTKLHQIEQLKEFEQTIQSFPQVLECFTLAGEYDYILKVVCRNSNDLQQFIRQLNGISEIIRIHSSISLRKVKFSTELPIWEKSENCINTNSGELI